jgi:protein-S-isoprenylcysteine O-methyltransferase Ste14
LIDAARLPLLLGIYAAAALGTALATSFIAAPYGRHTRPGWGPTLGNRLGWILMEAPAPLVFLGVFLTGPHRGEPVPALLLGLWLLHYVDRAFLYPFRLRGEGRQMPFLIPVMGASFNAWNGWINAAWVAHWHVFPGQPGPSFLAGAALFVLGFVINRHSDAVLRALRAPGETGYRVPHAGLHRLVTSPNYLGELLIWAGFAIAAASPPAWLFVLYTAANLVPRAFAHRRWYRERFPDYPRQRRAVIPWVL